MKTDFMDEANSPADSPGKDSPLRAVLAWNNLIAGRRAIGQILASIHWHAEMVTPLEIRHRPVAPAQQSN